MYISFWNTLRWLILVIWAVKAACVQRRVDTSQDFHWSQGACVPDTAVRKSSAFLRNEIATALGVGSTQIPVPSLSLLVLCLCIHSGIVCDGDRGFRAHCYIWSSSNCCNHSSERNFVGASAQKGVWGSWTADLESSSHLSPVPTSNTKEISLLHYWGLNLKGQVEAGVFSSKQCWTSSVSLIFLVNSG